jgi:hypothetical protein
MIGEGRRGLNRREHGRERRRPHGSLFFRSFEAVNGPDRRRRRAHRASRDARLSTGYRASKDARLSTGYERAIDSLETSEVHASMRSTALPAELAPVKAA